MAIGPDRRYMTAAQAQAAQIDVGLRQYMMRVYDYMAGALVLTGLVVLAPMLSGCENFDMDKLDVFHLNEKKKLPGERKELFPGGVPGVSQGIPPEYQKGYQQPADATQPVPGTEKEAVTPLPGANQPPAAAANPAPAAAPKTAVLEPATEAKPKPKKTHKAKAAPKKPPAQAAARHLLAVIVPAG